MRHALGASFPEPSRPDGVGLVPFDRAGARQAHCVLVAGYASVELKAFADNVAALRLYRRLGMVEA